MIRRRHLSQIALVLALACASVVAAATPAHALFHLMMVTEVFAGTSTAPDAQFIEMQMYAENQRFLTGHEVAVFDAAGNEIEAFTFTGPVANGANQAHVLLATPQAESEFGVEADFPMNPVLVAGGGSVCFRSADGGLIDCVSWGNYSGDDAETGTPFNSTLGLLPDQSMERVATGGSDPEGLDAEDDTNDSEADFDPSSPEPANNGGGDAEPEPEPESIDHDRSVSLNLRGSLVAKGRVTAEGEYEPCFQQVAVRVQRKSAGAWRTVARTTTTGDGAYRAELPDRPGRYRALAPTFSPAEGHRCLKGVSPVRRNG
ncbi:MAG TPA: hypothetical protein VG408_05410 [Actinomycetota bacterium]|nr:hypothetical protein [Actinomycetota bacterium]